MHAALLFEKRILKIVSAILCAFLVIVGRLIYLQVACGAHYSQKGERNFLRIEYTNAQRGNILDRHGSLLATNRPVIMLYWNGTGNRTLSGNQIRIIRLLEQVLDKNIIDSTSLFQSIRTAEKQLRSCLIAIDIPIKQLSKIQEQCANHPNIAIQTQFKRHYPHQQSASHVVGYIAGKHNAEICGQMGIEKLCDKSLQGTPGTTIKTINAVGRDMAHVKLENPLQGTPIYTTLDLAIQKVCEQVFPHTSAGTIIVMNPQDGSILGLVSRPTFDPSLFLKPISHEAWNKLQTDKPFLNRALNPYPTGSIFKLVSVSAALENGIITPDQEWDCKGFVHYAKRKYWCHKRWGHGLLDTMHAVAHSCNVLFFEIGKQIDIDLIAQYATLFGLGKPTGIHLPEKKGIVPSREWKLRNKGERWWTGETLSVTIGQSFLMATPLQIARLTGSIFTGFLVKPRILMSQEIEKKPLLLKPETIDFLKQSMKYVITHGTGRRVNAIEDIDIYAKTSTAQTSDFKKRKLGAEFMEHAWFVGHFQYKQHPPLVFVILVENAGTSRVSTTIAKRFLIEYKKLMDSNTAKI